jgi:hypothetical protein
MRLLPTLGAAISGLSLLLAAGASGASSPGPRPLAAVRAERLERPAPMRAGRAQIARDPHVTQTPKPCTSDYNPSFVAISNGTGDYAGNTSAVTGGFQDIACDADDGVLSGENNAVGNPGSGDADWSSIAGGENNSIIVEHGFIGSGESNAVSGLFGFVGAGESNTAGDGYAFVGGGSRNIAYYEAVVGGGAGNTASGDDSSVEGGYANLAAGSYAAAAAGYKNSAIGNGSFVGGGGYLTALNGGASDSNNSAAGLDAFIGSGDENVDNANDGFIGAGAGNVVNGKATYGTIGGGYSNVIAGNQQDASILGGYENDANGAYSTVPGGALNIAAGAASFAAGYQAEALHNGSFVWSDYDTAAKPLKDAKGGQFVVRASGGVTFYSNEAMTSGVSLPSGSGTWSSLSDRNAKTDIVPLDDASILAKVAALPLSSWRYKSEAGVRHMGPMAQDFYAAFGVGEDDRHITSIDEDGAALAAIKALHRENVRLEATNAHLEARLARLEAMVAALASTRYR